MSRWSSTTSILLQTRNHRTCQLLPVQMPLMNGVGISGVMSELQDARALSSLDSQNSGWEEAHGTTVGVPRPEYPLDSQSITPRPLACLL